MVTVNKTAVTPLDPLNVLAFWDLRKGLICILAMVSISF